MKEEKFTLEADLKILIPLEACLFVIAFDVDLDGKKTLSGDNCCSRAREAAA